MMIPIITPFHCKVATMRSLLFGKIFEEMSAGKLNKNGVASVVLYSQKHAARSAGS